MNTKRKKVEAWANVYADGSADCWHDSAKSARKDAELYGGATRIAVPLREVDPASDAVVRAAVRWHGMVSDPRTIGSDSRSDAFLCLERAVEKYLAKKGRGR